ncbi:MAG: hypothetical protein FWE32_02120 [Oscillospiraceae bacterium]|nr:hypothetical protein [Oscillospiraceae bacterium]
MKNTSRQSHIVRILANQVGCKDLSSFIKTRIPSLGYYHVSRLASQDMLHTAKDITLEKLADGFGISVEDFKQSLKEQIPMEMIRRLTPSYLTNAECQLISELRLLQSEDLDAYTEIKALINRAVSKTTIAEIQLDK